MQPLLSGWLAGDHWVLHKKRMGISLINIDLHTVSYASGSEKLIMGCHYRQATRRPLGMQVGCSAELKCTGMGTSGPT